MSKRFPKRGEVYWVKLDPVVGSEIAKTRPCLIVSHNAGNEVSPQLIVAPITSSIKRIFPFEVPIEIGEKKGKILLNQIRCIDKVRLSGHIDRIDSKTMDLVDEALKLVLALD